MRSNENWWRCPTCSYDLRATTDSAGAHCPECGSTFTREQLITAADRAERRLARLQLWVLWLPTPVALFAVPISTWLWKITGWWPVAFTVLVAFLVTGYTVSVVSLLRSDDAPLPWLTAFPMTILVLIMNIVIMLVLGALAAIAGALLFG